ncbi:cation:proton antiporter regulatory subunit [Fuchsiella alkaliacetigena]|uniref:cation:proton antiporter regulatory subunit n=1 Tax=Fuchsiella alkaliacetigena TaxID=957042 RepID=UPI00200AE458|nr:TrkA C-terminal domain-containing protein [Fuchsiella alkaliacetigena]MCK8825051.1 hypothetical protein [Fuchsiella alkaliacetigena]
MEIKKSDLFGIGKKYSLKTTEDEILVLIIHHNGKRELYFLDDEEDDEAKFSVQLTDLEAREIGALIMGSDYQPATEKQARMLHDDILIEWVEVKPTSCLTDKTIIETDLRAKTGVTILGIKRGESFIGSPDPEEKMINGDIIMVTGKKEAINYFKEMCYGELEG